MAILIKKIFRELWRSKARSIVVILTLGMSISIFAGFMLGYVNIVASFDETEHVTNYQDFRVSFNNYAHLSYLDNFDEDVSGISSYDYRIWQPSALKIGTQDQEQEGLIQEYTTYIHGIPGDRLPRVNSFLIEEGEYFSSFNAPEILLNIHFAESKGIKVGDSVRIFNGTGYEPFLVRGVVWSPEYTYVVNRLTALPDFENLAPIWMPIAETQRMFGLGSFFNEVLVRIEDDANVDDVINDVIKTFEQEGFLVSITKAEDEPDTFMREQDIGFMDDMAYIFGFMVLIVAIFILWDAISKLVESQRTYIGVMRSLGGSKQKIIRHYVGFAFVLSIISSILGLLFAYFLAIGFQQIYLDILKIPVSESDIPAAIPSFILAVVTSVGISIVISLLSSLSIARIKPRDALSSAYVQEIYSKKPLLERIITKIPGFRSLSIRVPIRGLLRNKKKSLLTFITFGTSMLIVFGTMGFVNSFMYQLDYYYIDIERQDMAAYMLNPTNETGLVEQFEALDHIEEAELFINAQIQITAVDNNKTRSTQLQGYKYNTSLRGFNTKNGHNVTQGLHDDNSVYLGSIIAKRLEVTIGDSVRIGNHSLVVADILQELVDQNIIVGYDLAQEILGLKKMATGALLRVSEVDAAKKELLESPLAISFILVKSEIHDGILHMMEAILGVLYMVILIGFIVLSLFSFHTIVMDVMHRELEFMNFRALGSSTANLYKIIGTQGIIIAIFGTLAGIPIGFLGINRFNTVLEDMMYVQTYLEPTSFIITIGVALLSSFVGIWAGVRHVRKMKLVDATMNRAMH